MVELLAQHEGDDALKEYLPQLQKEYAYWMEGVETLQPGQQNQRVVKLEDGSVLNRYWDDRDTPRPESWVEDIATAKSNPNRPATEIYRDLRSAAASGWDFSSRWMDNPQQLSTIRTTTIVPVDLNALLYQLEKTLARASAAAGDRAKASHYDALANARQKAIEMHLWNNKEGWYADYDLKNNKIRDQLTAAALFPLYVNAAAKIAPRKWRRRPRRICYSLAGWLPPRLKADSNGMRQTAGRRYNGSLPKDCKIMGRMTWQWKSPGAF